MTRLERAIRVSGLLPSFFCGVAAVVLAHVLFDDVQAQPTKRVVVACADAAGVLRIPEAPSACPQGQKLVPLTPIELKPDEKPPEDRAAADLERRLRDLEGRVKGKGRMLGSPVEAPFEVFNDAGVKIFSVEEASLGGGEIKVFNNASKHVAWIYGSDRGWARAMSATSDLRTELSVDGLTVVNHDLTKHRVNLGRTTDTRYGLSLYNMNETVVAGIGQSEVESGLALIADEEGKPRLRMMVQDNAGKVAIVNTEDIEVATLGVDAQQNGLLQLFNGQGIKMVEAGTLDTGIGVVKAGPGAFQPGFGPLGLPGSYIQGKK